MEKYKNDLLFLLKKAARGEPALGENVLSSGDLRSILQLSDRHCVFPLITQHLLKTDAEASGSVPLPGKAEIDVARMKVIHQAQRTADLGLLLSHLAKAGLRPVIMKGAVCRVLYPVPAARPSVDEDFLIPPDQAADYHRELTAYGFRTSVDDEAIDGADEITYFSTECRMCVEVHKYPFPRDQRAYAHLNGWLEGAYSRAEEVRCGRFSLLTLCSTDHLIYMLFHVYKHFLHGGFGIRQVCDIGLFSEKNIGAIDWGRVRQVCREAGIYTFAAAVFAVAVRHLLGETELKNVLDEEVLSSIDEMPLLDDIMDSGVYGASTMSRMHSSTMTLNAAERQVKCKSKRWRRSGADLISTVFPPVDYMAMIYPVLKKAPILLPFTWAVRIIRYLKEHLRTSKSGDTAAKSVKIGRERIALMEYYGIIDHK